MDNTANLSLPYILPSQAQKAVTHNEALRRLDVVAMLAVASRSLATPPAVANEGDRFIVAGGATAAWAGIESRVAAFQRNGWNFLQPQEGWIAWCVEEGNLLCFSGSSWSPTNALTLENVPKLGINMAPDETNRLAVASGATLFSHYGADHRIFVNKAAETDTASIVFQHAYSGRVEIGLAGNDLLSVKVSSDGVGFSSAMEIDAATGKDSFPANNLLESFMLYVFPDAGRLVTANPGAVTVGAFSWPAYLTLNNGATAAALAKFIYDNSDYGGAGTALQTDVKRLIDRIREPWYRRYNIEFWVAEITGGPGVTSGALTVRSDVGRLSLFSSSLVRPPALTFHVYLKALDDSILVNVAAGQTAYKDGTKFSEWFAITVADGWVSVTIHDQLDQRYSYGYQPSAVTVYAKAANNRYFVAAPALMAGITKIDDNIGIVASNTGWSAWSRCCGPPEPMQ